MGTCRLRVKKLYGLHHVVRTVDARKNGYFQTAMWPSLDDGHRSATLPAQITFRIVMHGDFSKDKFARGHAFHTR